jgi:hypothetical protein
MDAQDHLDIPRSEHPRPDFQREHWATLNGRWRFTFDARNVGEQKRWYRVPHPTAAKHLGEVSSPVEDPFTQEILVPFPWESHLSGVSDPTYKGAAWYQRSIEVPVEWAAPASSAGRGRSAGQPAGGGDAVTQWRWRPFLRFEAVDWNTKVWIDGRFVAEHDGGFTPFAVDISRYTRPGRPVTLTVRVWDACDADTLLGKQTEDWYTHSGGIWQTVWLEGRPANYVSGLHVTPDLPGSHATFAVDVESVDSGANGAVTVAVASKDGAFETVHQAVDLAAGHARAVLHVPIPDARPWSPEDPYLYECVVTLTPDATSAPNGGPADAVHTYFGLRSVSSGRWEDKPYEYVLLNGEPVYLRGVLDQAFHPEGVYAYPSDDVLRGDLQAAKDLGLNMVRCHIKINEPRYYYWADKLGLLVMYDFPSASIYTPKARANWERTFRESLDRDYSHPCIFSWVLFNETWGLEEHRTPASWEWVKEMYYLCKALDSTRLVEDNSPFLWDHVTTDINTWHFYIDDYDRARRHMESVVQQTFEGSPFHYVGGVYADVQGAEIYKQGTQPLLNSEYAGISAWGGDRDISYTFKFLTTELRRHDKICGYVYTELTDVEWEHNGLLNYDRSPKEFGYDAFFAGMRPADVNGADFVGFDCPPCQTLRPGSVFRAATFVSHWDRRRLEGAQLRWRVTAVNRFGESLTLDEGGRAVQPRQYGVVDVGEIEAQLPDEAALATIALWLEDGTGAVRARNYVNVDVYASRAVPEIERTERGCVMRFLPGDFAASSWMDPRIGPRGSKFGGVGAGWVDYVLGLPEDLDPQAVRGLRLTFEAGARTARNRIDWKDPRYMSGWDYPQTEARKLPSEVVVWLNGVRAGSVRLNDDPADSRGVLSVHNSEHWEGGSYGFVHTVAPSTAATKRILSQAQNGRLVVRFEVPRDGTAGGFNLYGARMGSSPVAPTVILET